VHLCNWVAMGNALLTTHKFACGHTDRGQLQQSLLGDRLSEPTAEMVEAVLALQGQTVRLQQFAEQGLSVPAHTISEIDRRPLLLLATAYCILFGYRCQSTSSGASAALSRGVDPQQPNDFLDAFQCALQHPQEFLQDLLTLRAQVVSRDKLMRLLPLVQDTEVQPSAFGGPFSDVLQQLALFIRAAIECAEIYAEIRESASAGHLDGQQAARLLDGVESDQRRMISAMGSASQYDEHEEENGYP